MEAKTGAAEREPHPRAGRPPTRRMLVNVQQLVETYHHAIPGAQDLVAFGTSGHRGSGSKFTEQHIAAITQAIVDYRKDHSITGPLYLGMDTHPLSRPAHETTVEVLAGNSVATCAARKHGFTPTPVISHAILTHNDGRTEGLADGIVITPSHNPPTDGGIKYNPPHGGPAEASITGWIQARANHYLRDGGRGVRRVALDRQGLAEGIDQHDFITPYVADLEQVVDLDAIRGAGLRLGVDAMGNAALAYWAPIAERYGLNLDIVNDRYAPRFAFMTVDHDGKIRMDCSSPYAMAGFLARAGNQYDVAWANDTDVDRHGIVSAGRLMNPNHYLAVAIDYLFRNRPAWAAHVAVGKTLVSSALIDRVAAALGRRVYEVPVGFKYFVAGLLDGTLGFGGEESAGASFLRRNGRVWTTDKDGLIMGLLAAEIMARTSRSPMEHYRHLTQQFCEPAYARIDTPASDAQRNVLKQLAPSAVSRTTLAGEPIVAVLDRAPGDNEPIGGIKVISPSAWFAARPSGTEDIAKLYAESFKGPTHLQQVLRDAQQIVDEACRAAGVT